MDIKNLPSHQNSKLNETDPASKNRKGADISPEQSSGNYSDKVSLEQYTFRDNEQLFAKAELEKFNRASFDKLKAISAKLSEYQSAKQTSGKEADQTDIGKMLNNPNVWEKIAQKMTEL